MRPWIILKLIHHPHKTSLPQKVTRKFTTQIYISRNNLIVFIVILRLYHMISKCGLPQKGQKYERKFQTCLCIFGCLANCCVMQLPLWMDSNRKVPKWSFLGGRTLACRNFSGSPHMYCSRTIFARLGSDFDNFLLLYSSQYYGQLNPAGLHNFRCFVFYHPPHKRSIQYVM